MINRLDLVLRAPAELELYVARTTLRESNVRLVLGTALEHGLQKSPEA